MLKKCDLGFPPFCCSLIEFGDDLGLNFGDKVDKLKIVIIECHWLDRLIRSIISDSFSFVKKPLG